jgi:signal transduction histidine kinase
MTSPSAGEISTGSWSRLVAALLDLAADDRTVDAAAFSAVARYAAGIVAADAAGVLRFLGGQRAVIVGVWREPGVRGMPVNAELDFDSRNSALGRAHSTGRPARADSYEGLHGELPVVMRVMGLRSSVAAPILLAERPWGAVVATTSRDEPLAADAEERLGELAELVARAVAIAGTRRALEASRLRIVEDADATRRRLERELHEGPHQQVLALLLKLRAARAKAGNGTALADLLDDAIREATDADTALRELARGLFPLVLTERGLAAAVQALALRSRAEVNLARLPSRRFPALAEATAYFVVEEALAPATDATGVEVVVADEGDHLAVEVRHDHRVDVGEGLRAVSERVGALGGVFVVDSSSTSGTIVTAAIPLGHPAPVVNGPG